MAFVKRVYLYKPLFPVGQDPPNNNFWVFMMRDFYSMTKYPTVLAIGPHE